MKVINLTQGSKMYTSNVYLVRGTWNAIRDVNTLVDVGRDPLVIESVKEAPTGVGKKRVEQVILTHSHYDHASLLPEIRKAFRPIVYAFSPSLEGVDHILRDGDILRLGDRIFEVIHTPGHSNDSICLYCEEDGVLFAGDTPLLINSTDGSYEDQFISALQRICQREVKSIYFGHGNPVISGSKALLSASLENVKKAQSTWMSTKVREVLP